MVTFTARTGSGATLDPAVPESLRPFLVRAAADLDGPVELSSERSAEVHGPADVPDPTGRRILASPQPDGSWSVRLPAGESAALAARTPNTDAVFDLLRSWAADDGWWQEAFSWSTVDAD